MQNPQCEMIRSRIRVSRQVAPTVAFPERSRSQPPAAFVAAEAAGEHAGEADGQRPSQLAHDARNLIAALELSCEVLASPGVLAPGFGHYAGDLRRLAESAGRLIEALVAKRAKSGVLPGVGPFPLASGLSPRRFPEEGNEGRAREENEPEVDRVAFRRHPFPEIEDLAGELMALEGPLRALAGREVCLEFECLPCPGRLALNSEDLLRILFNLVANAVEAMALTPAEFRRRPFLRITTQRGGAASFLPRSGQQSAETVVLAVRDNGPGIAAEALPHIFDPGFSTRHGRGRSGAGWRRGSGEASRGHGLAIVRELVAAAGGAVRAVSPPGFGVRFDIELPILGAEVKQFGTRLGRVKRKLPYLQQISAQNEKEA